MVQQAGWDVEREESKPSLATGTAIMSPPQITLTDTWTWETSTNTTGLETTLQPPASPKELHRGGSSPRERRCPIPGMEPALPVVTHVRPPFPGERRFLGKRLQNPTSVVMCRVGLVPLLSARPRWL